MLHPIARSLNKRYNPGLDVYWNDHRKILWLYQTKFNVRHSGNRDVQLSFVCATAHKLDSFTEPINNTFPASSLHFTVFLQEFIRFLYLCAFPHFPPRRNSRAVLGNWVPPSLALSSPSSVILKLCFFIKKKC